MNFLKLFLSLVVVISAASVESFKFLVILHWSGRSHFIIGSTLAKALAEKGHEVTVVSQFPQKTPIKNYHDVPLYNVKNADDVSKVMQNLFDLYEENFLSTVLSVFNFGFAVTKATLEEQSVQELLRSNQTFDAVICEAFFSEALYGFSEHFNAPLIAFAPMAIAAMHSDMIGTPLPASYVPHVFTSFSEHMTLWERLLNFVYITFERVYMNFVYLPRQESLYRQYFPHAKRSFYDVRKNTALMLVNQHVSLSFAQPNMPNQIEVAGMHINRKRTPLPKDIQDFIDNAKHGVIYFSLGTNLKISSLPAPKLRAIIDTFRELKERVLWKSDLLQIPDKPDNVLISSWFPQDDILAHPNVKLFITHGGLLSTTETIYHGKPIIGLPIFADQFLNMKRAERHNYGLTLSYRDFSNETFKHAIEELLNNPVYGESVREVSQHYHDQPMEPLQRAIYWVEHVVRQKGAKYMHCAGLELSFIEYHNIDVMAILFSGLTLIVGLIYVLIVKLFGKCFGITHKYKSVEKVKRKIK